MSYSGEDWWGGGIDECVSVGHGVEECGEVGITIREQTVLGLVQMIRGGDNLCTGWVSAGLGSGFAGKPGPGSLCLFVFCFITSSAPVLAKLSISD